MRAVIVAESTSPVYPTNGGCAAREECPFVVLHGVSRALVVTMLLPVEANRERRKVVGVQHKPHVGAYTKKPRALGVRGSIEDPG